jgi:O-antigen ligase
MIIIHLFFLIWILESLKDQKILIDTRPRFVFLIFFVFFVSLSYFWAEDQERALRKLLFLFSILPIYFISFSYFEKKTILNDFLKALFWGNFIISILGLIQFFGQFLLGIDLMIKITEKYINPLFLGHNFAQAVSQYPSWLVRVGNFDILRTFSIFPDPHLFSIFINISLPFILLLYFKTKKVSYLIGFIVMLFSSILSFSRAGYLALISSFLVSLLVFKPINPFKKPLFFVSLLFIILFLVLTNNPLKKRLISSFDLSEGSVVGRIEMWQKGLEITALNPLGGIGLGNFPLFIDRSSTPRDPSYSHNLFLDFSSEAGVFASFFVILMIISPIFSYFTRKGDIVKKTLLFSFLILFVHSLFETPFYSVHAFPLILILLSLKEGKIIYSNKVALKNKVDKLCLF